jgi:hypothetical protein
VAGRCVGQRRAGAGADGGRRVVVPRVRFIDQTLGRVLAEAQRERARSSGGALARRTETIRILDGALTTPPPRAAASATSWTAATAVVVESAVAPHGAPESAGVARPGLVGSQRPLTLPEERRRCGVDRHAWRTGHRGSARRGGSPDDGGAAVRFAGHQGFATVTKPRDRASAAVGNPGAVASAPIES